MIGTDVHFWEFFLHLLPMLCVFLSFVAMLIFNRHHPDRKIPWGILVLVAVVWILTLWATFGAYGPGTPQSLPNAFEEGVNLRMDDVGFEDLPAAARKAESKVPEALKQVREHVQGGPGPESIDEDDYFHQTIERALQIHSNQKSRKGSK